MPFPAIGGLTGQHGQVSGSIARAASLTGIDFDYLLAQAGVESSFDPNAKARTSSATGLFQFTEQTWLSMVSRHGTKYGLDWAANAVRAGSDGRYRVSDPQLRSRVLNLRYDPQASSFMAAEFANENRAHLRSKIGWEPESVDLYLAHFLGAGGAGKFLSNWSANPDASAAPLFPDAARANRAIFYGEGGAPRSLEDIRALFDRKLANAGAQPASHAAGRTRYDGNLELALAGALPMEADPMGGTLGITGYPMITPAPRMIGGANGYSATLRSMPAASNSYKPLQLQEIIPMPKRLSVDFARSTYERFSGSEVG